MMKKLIFFLVISIFLFGCQSVPEATLEEDVTSPAVDFNATPAPYLTPIVIPPIVLGEDIPVKRFNSNWTIVQDENIGFSVHYPPEWLAITSENGEINLYPPGSSPDFPSASINLVWFSTPYQKGKPIFIENVQTFPVLIAGLEGQQYQDEQFALPVQNVYMEIPYKDGVIFVSATIGPSVNLMPQLEIILQSMELEGIIGDEDSPDTYEISISANRAWQNSNIYVEAGDTIDFTHIDGQWTDWKGTTPYTNGIGMTGHICANMADPESCVEPIPQAPRGSLIGKIGTWSFLIGNRRILTAEQTGYLYLRINDGDDGLFDNDGELVVQIILSP